MKQGDTPQRIWNVINGGGYFYVCGYVHTLRFTLSNNLLSSRVTFFFRSFRIVIFLLTRDSDAKLMARDVGDTLTSIVSTFGGLDAKTAEKYVEKLIADARLQQDVWS